MGPGRWSKDRCGHGGDQGNQPDGGLLQPALASLPMGHQSQVFVFFKQSLKAGLICNLPIKNTKLAINSNLYTLLSRPKSNTRADKILPEARDL